MCRGLNPGEIELLLSSESPALSFPLFNDVNLPKTATGVWNSWSSNKFLQKNLVGSSRVCKFPLPIWSVNKTLCEKQRKEMPELMFVTLNLVHTILTVDSVDIFLKWHYFRFRAHKIFGALSRALRRLWLTYMQVTTWAKTIYVSLTLHEVQ